MTPGGTTGTPSERPSRARLIVLVAVAALTVALAAASCGPRRGSFSRCDDVYAVARVFWTTERSAREDLPLLAAGELAP